MTRGNFLRTLGAAIIAPKTIVKVLAKPTTDLTYFAGFSTISRQAMKNLPFLQETLPGFIMRDLVRSELSDNDYVKFPTI